MAKSAKLPDHYETLDLPFPLPSLTSQQLKLAYHKALLKHHPDKAKAASIGPTSPSSPTSAPSAQSQTYTIDQITTAYKTLSNATLRKSYDLTLREIRAERKKGDAFHTGLEPIDLEDFECEQCDTGDVWFRGCRCGDESGFIVTEEDLEKEVETGELVVGCRGCSLWVKVLFAVDGDDQEMDNGVDGNANGGPVPPPPG